MRVGWRSLDTEDEEGTEKKSGEGLPGAGRRHVRIFVCEACLTQSCAYAEQDPDVSRLGAERGAFEARPWGRKFPTAVAAWRRAWERVILLFVVPRGVSGILCARPC